MQLFLGKEVTLTFLVPNGSPGADSRILSYNKPMIPVERRVVIEHVEQGGITITVVGKKTLLFVPWTGVLFAECNLEK